MGANVPDLRGLFLRGYGSQTFEQNNGVTCGVTSTDHSSGNLNAIQGDAIRNMTGIVGGMTDQGNGTGIFYEAYSSGACGAGSCHNGLTKKSVKFSADRVMPTDVEIRPVNMAVRYLIRAIS